MNTESNDLMQYDDSYNDDELDAFAPVRPNRRKVYKQILKNILPFLGTDEVKIVLAEVMIALKIEGILSKDISDKDQKMIDVIKESILIKPERKQEALKFAERLLLENKRKGA